LPVSIILSAKKRKILSAAAGKSHVSGQKRASGFFEKKGLSFGGFCGFREWRGQNCYGAELVIAGQYKHLGAEKDSIV
jgi:hypothetical protein